VFLPFFDIKKEEKREKNAQKVVKKGVYFTDYRHYRKFI
jgi:hypothetical protein